MSIKGIIALGAQKEALEEYDIAHLDESKEENSSRKTSRVIVIIPAYNEAHSIEDIIHKTREFSTLIIVVDDGSNDGTSDLCRSLNVRVIRNSRRMGKGIALKRGIIEAIRYDPDIVVTLDADGQHDPFDLPKLLEPILNSEADIVIGSRYFNAAMRELPYRRRIGLSIINRLNALLTRTSVKDSQSGFRAYDKNVIEKIVGYTSTGYGVETEQLALADSYGFRIVEVPVKIRYYGLKKTSNKNSYLHGGTIIFTIIRILFEKKPLTLFGLLGVALLVGALGTGTQMLVLFNDTRYFSIPLGLLTLGLVLCGAFLLLVAVIFYTLSKIRLK
jgi:glycosyltransferase involved in cell wall biosynthesis